MSELSRGVVVVDVFDGGFLSLPQRPPLSDDNGDIYHLGHLRVWWFLGHGPRDNGWDAGGPSWGTQAAPKRWRPSTSCDDNLPGRKVQWC